MLQPEVGYEAEDVGVGAEVLIDFALELKLRALLGGFTHDLFHHAINVISARVGGVAGLLEGNVEGDTGPSFLCCGLAD